MAFAIIYNNVRCFLRDKYKIHIHCRKIPNLFVRALKTSRNVRLAEHFSTVLRRIQMNFIFFDNVHVLFLSCNHKTMVPKFKKENNAQTCCGSQIPWYTHKNFQQKKTFFRHPSSKCFVQHKCFVCKDHSLPKKSQLLVCSLYIKMCVAT